MMRRNFISLIKIKHCFFLILSPGIFSVLSFSLAAYPADSIHAERCIYDSNKIIIPGDLIKEIGTSSAEKGDISDPGLVLNIRKN